MRTAGQAVFSGRITSAPGGVGSTLRGLTRSSDLTREGLAMQATRNDRRRVSADPHPSLRDAVAVSRFWRLVDQRTPDECWPWLGDDDQGYGVFFYQGRLRRAPELALSFTTGEQRLPELDTCHTCDNPPCCNPAHLRFDTRASNVGEMVARGRASRHSLRIPDADVALIRRRRAAGARQQDLADQYGVSPSHISNIVRGISRPEAGGPIQTERQYHRG